MEKSMGNFWCKMACGAATILPVDEKQVDVSDESAGVLAGIIPLRDIRFWCIIAPLLQYLKMVVFCSMHQATAIYSYHREKGK
jgi:hypothetical protein